MNRKHTRGIRTATAFIALMTVACTEELAAQDCAFGSEDMDDIQRIRRCLDLHGPGSWTDDYGRTLLHTAAEFTANPTVVAVLLDAGFDPNARTDGGETPLHLGARNPNPTVAFHLFAAGADPNARDNRGFTPLHLASADGHARVVRGLLDHGANPLAETNDGETPLRSALLNNADPSVVSILLDAGADEHLTPLQLSALRRDTTGVNWLLANGTDPNETDRYGWGPLHFAVPRAGLELVSALLAAGADPDIETRTSDGLTTLHIAAQRAPEPVVSALLAAGADANAKSEFGWSPLYTAIASGSWRREEGLLSVVVSLLQAGADPGRSDADRDAVGRSALDYALAVRAAPPVVQALLEAGADPIAGNKDGWTPLHQAAFSRRHTSDTDDIAIIVELTELLLDAGADVRAETEWGFRPMHYLRPGYEAFWLLVVAEETLAAGRTLTDSLTSSDSWDQHEYDVWAVTAETVGQRLVIDMESYDLDAYLRVFRQDGTLVAADDDGGSGLNARVEFQAVYAGVYFVIATSYGEGETGEYRVRVR